MRILQICNKPPYPAIDGGCIAMNNITKGLLAENHSVKVLTISTDKHPFVKSNYSEHYLKQTQIEFCYVDTNVNPIDAFSALVTSDSYNISRFFTPDFDILLKNTLEVEEFDVVHIESLFMTPYIDTIRKYNPKAKIILRSHNLEHLIWERLANTAKNKAKKIYLKYLAKKLKQYESSILPNIDGIAAITKADYKRYQKLNKDHTKLETIPFGIDLEQYKFQKYQGNAKTYFHLGAMNWNPNIEAVDWMLQVICPKVIKKIPDIKLQLAGREMNPKYKQFESQNLQIDGEVDDAHKYMHTNGIMIVPLLSGGGMRVKIIEGMALGCPIITTSIGIEGIHAKHGKHVLIADTPAEFMEVFIQLISNPKLATELSVSARKLVEEKYDNKKILKKLIQFYKD